MTPDNITLQAVFRSWSSHSPEPCGNLPAAWFVWEAGPTELGWL